MKMRLAEEIGLGCAVALISSAVAMIGSTTILGMSQLISDNHAPSEFEQAARRVALTSLVVGGLSVTGLAFAVKSEEEDWFLESLTVKQSEIDWLNVKITVLNIELESAKQLSRQNYAGLVEKGQEVATLRKTIEKLHETNKQRHQRLYEWEGWWEKVQDLDSSYNVLGCKGCKHFNGSNHGETFFVCAMHPYGMRRCEDWE